MATEEEREQELRDLNLETSGGILHELALAGAAYIAKEKEEKILWQRPLQ